VGVPVGLSLGLRTLGDRRYGGDGVGHTRDGTVIDPFDRLGIQRPEPDPRGRALEFEAAWGPDGRCLCAPNANSRGAVDR
jgi:hypothetical protein